MNKITWTGDRFECNNPELEDAKRETLLGTHRRFYEFMKACDLPIYDYSYGVEGDIYIHRWSDKDKIVYFSIADEGTGFNVCFHLGAYAIASMNLGQKLEICAYSFKPLLHPVLFQGLRKWFGDRKAEEVDKKCPYYSGDYSLKCAVNPSLPCKDCSDASAGFNESLFLWRSVDFGWMSAPEAPTPRLWIESARLWIESAGFTHMLHPPINAERVMSRSISIGISGDISQVQEAIARLRRVIPEQPFTEGVIGVDMGSGEDATAIATGFTAEGGSVPINSLEINASTSVFADAIARMQEAATQSMALSERLLYGEGQGVANHLAKSYQCGLSDRITPFSPRLEEVRREYQGHSARIWTQFGGMPIQRPSPSLILHDIGTVSAESEENLPTLLGMTPEDLVEYKANGTLFAEVNKRLLERTNETNNQTE
jgi:hypothetical protein